MSYQILEIFSSIILAFFLIFSHKVPQNKCSIKKPKIKADFCCSKNGWYQFWALSYLHLISGANRSWQIFSSKMERYKLKNEDFFPRERVSKLNCVIYLSVVRQSVTIWTALLKVIISNWSTLFSEHYPSFFYKNPPKMHVLAFKNRSSLNGWPLVTSLCSI